MPSDTAVIHTDGASRSNPGPAGVGAVIEYKGQIIEICEYLGEATNNVAEYMALIRALEKASELQIASVSVFMDSQLIVRQIEGKYKVKNEGLRPLYKQAKTLADSFSKFKIAHIPREENTHADRISKEASDNNCPEDTDALSPQPTEDKSLKKEHSQNKLPF